MSRNKIFENEKGFIVEDSADSKFSVYIWGIVDYDGIRERGLAETTFTYSNGFYSSLDHIGRYYANYFPDRYKGRGKALKAAKKLLEV